MKNIVLLFITFLLFKISFSQVLINVPTDFASIQIAIDNSSDGDTILVSPGSYHENINFNGKNIILSSYFFLTNDTSYISSTIIDGDQSGACVTFNSDESSEAILTGFTLKNGGGTTSSGGGILIVNSSPTINYLIIENNNANDGGGIYINENCNSLLSNIIIRNNTANHGAGIFVTSSLFEDTSPLFKNIEVSNNFGSISGGLHLRDWSNATFINATIFGNSTLSDGGGYGDIGGVLVWYPATNANFINSIA